MSLLAVRDRFLVYSGRADLGTVAGADKGANVFINAGQRSLDLRQQTIKSATRFAQDITAGTYIVEFGGDNSVPPAASINSVWLTQADKRIALSEKDIRNLRLDMGKPFSAITAGDPCFYAHNVIQRTPNNSLTATNGMDDITSSANPHKVSGIVIMPPPDEAWTVEIWGWFYSDELSADADTSYWTEVHPDLLVYAALREIEASYRNTTGIRDWEEAMSQYILGIDRSLVDTQVAQIDQMVG